jgi:putative transcriptional regulator
MNAIRTYTLETLPPDKTNWARVRKLTEKQINAAARSDKDNPLSTKKQLAKFKRVHPIDATEIKRIREKLHLSQAVFASYFQISERTLQEWEQGRRRPTGAACTLLAIIKNDPHAVAKALMQK